MFDSVLKAGTASKIVEVTMRDSTTGMGKTGLAFGSVSASYVREGGTRTAITLVTGTAGDAYSSGKWAEVDSTNCKGLYQLHIPDAALAAGVKSVTITLQATGVLDKHLRISLTSIDFFDAVRGGMTALPNANAEAAGGLYTRGSGAGQINQTNNGQIDVNAARLGGTVQTGRDVGASVLLSPGTGTGQVDLTSGQVKVQSGTSAGQILSAAGQVTVGTNNDKTGYSLSAAALQAIWDVLTTALTTPSSIGAALVQAFTDIGTLLTRLSATRAGYLDKLNISGNVASSAEATAIQNNTRVVRVVPVAFERPDSGSTSYTIELLLYDEVGNMEVPDSAPTVDVVNEGGTSRNGNLSATTMALISTGRYRVTYTIDTAHLLEQLVFAFTVVEGGATRVYANTGLVVDTTAVDFTAADRTKLNRLDTDYTTARAGKIDNLDATVSSVNTGLSTLSAIFTGMTSLPKWLRGIFRKDAMDATAKAEVNLTGGTYDESTDSLEKAAENLAAVSAKTTNLPADPADASDIAAAFTVIDNAIANLATQASVDTLQSTATATKAVTDKLNLMIVANGGDWQFDTLALALAPAGGSGGSGDASLANQVIIIDLLQSDSSIDKTNPAQWQKVWKKAGTATELMRKNVKDVDGAALHSTEVVIGGEIAV